MEQMLALLHTSRSMIAPFEALAREWFDGWQLVNRLIDFPFSDGTGKDYMDSESLNSVYGTLRTLQLSGAGKILVTSPFLFQAVRQFRPLIRIPMAVLGEAASRQAAASGTRITVLAGTQENGQAINRQISAFKPPRGNKPPEIEVLLCPSVQELSGQNLEAAGCRLREAALEIKNRDTVILADPWMDRFTSEIAGICGAKVLPAAGLCIRQLAEDLQNPVKKDKIDAEGSGAA